MIRRNTVQKDLILKAVTDMMSHVTADEVYEKIKKDYPNVGKGTVYRNLAILSAEGKIRRVEIPNGPDRFDFTLENHYHSVCVKCGNVSDVNMEYIPDMMGKIKSSVDMDYIGYDILFKGICRNCSSLKDA